MNILKDICNKYYRNWYNLYEVLKYFYIHKWLRKFVFSGLSIDICYKKYFNMQMSKLEWYRWILAKVLSQIWIPIIIRRKTGGKMNNHFIEKESFLRVVGYLIKKIEGKGRFQNIGLIYKNKLEELLFALTSMILMDY